MASAKNGRFLAPRAWAIVKHRNLWITISIALICLILLQSLDLPPLSPPVTATDLMTPLIGFTSIGFTVSITATALVIALPSSRTVSLMVVNGINNKRTQIRYEDNIPIAVDRKTEERSTEHIQTKNDRSGFMDLIFVFLWTAVCSASTSLAAIFWIVASGKNEILSAPTLASDAITCTILAMTVYTALQILVALKTVYSVAFAFQTAIEAEIIENTNNRK